MNIHQDIVGVVQHYPSVFYILCFLSASLFFVLGKNWNRGLQFETLWAPSKRKAKRNCGSRRKKYLRSQQDTQNDDKQNKSPNGTKNQGERCEKILRSSNKTKEKRSVSPRKRTSQRHYNSEKKIDGKHQQQQQQPQENDYRHQSIDDPAGPGPPYTALESHTLKGVF